MTPDDRRATVFFSCLVIGGGPLLAGGIALLGGSMLRGPLPQELLVSGVGWQIFDAFCIALLIFGFTYGCTPDEPAIKNPLTYLMLFVGVAWASIFVVTDLNCLSAIRADSKAFAPVIEKIADSHWDRNDYKSLVTISEAAPKFPNPVKGAAFVIRNGENPVPLLRMPQWCSERATNPGDLDVVVLIDDRRPSEDAESKRNGYREPETRLTIVDWRTDQLVWSRTFQGSSSTEFVEHSRDSNYRYGRRSTTHHGSLWVALDFAGVGSELGR